MICSQFSYSIQPETSVFDQTDKEENKSTNFTETLSFILFRNHNK